MRGAEHADRTPPARSQRRGSNTCAVTGRADRTPAPRSTPHGSNTYAAPNTWIEHLQRDPNDGGSNICAVAGHRSNTCTPLHAARIEHLRGAEHADRTPPARSERRRIEHLRSGGARRSNTSTLLHAKRIEHLRGAEPTDRTFAQWQGAPIEHLHPAPRQTDRTSARHRTHGSNTSGALPTPRIEHLRGGGARRSNTSTLLHAARIEHLRGAEYADRTHPARSQRRGSNICAMAGRRRSNTCTPAPRRTDRTPARRRTHGSNTSSALRTPRIEHLRGGGAHRHPSGRLDPAVRTLAGRADRTLARPPGARIEQIHAPPGCRIEHLPDAWIEHLRGRRGRGSNSSGLLDVVDRTLAQSSEMRIETLPARSTPRIDTLRGRRGADRHPSRSPDRHPSAVTEKRGSTPLGPLDPADRDPSRSSGRGSTPFTVAGRRESGRSFGGTAVSTERTAALLLPPGSTTPEPRETK